MNIEMLEEAPLTLQTRAALALNSTKTERDLIALASKNKSIVTVTNKDGRTQAHSAAMELRTARTTITKVSKDAREDAKAFQSAIIEEERRLIALVEPEENRLIALRDKWDDEQAQLKAEAEAKERARITAIHANIAEIRNFLMLAGQCRTAERIQGLIEKLEAIQREGWDGFDEFAAEAGSIAATTFDAMVKLHAAKVQDEEAAARAKAEAEAAAAALAEQRKAQAEESAKLAAERAAFAAEQAAFKAQQAAAAALVEAEARQAREAQERADYAAAIAATPVAPAPAPAMTTISGAPVSDALVAQFNKTFGSPSTLKAWRPTDIEIIDALAEKFGVLDVRVLEWLRAMDFDLVEETLKVAA